MTVMSLAAQHTDLFAAELFVSGRWDVGELDGPAEQKFVYIADVNDMLKSAGVSYQSATWDATWSAEEYATAAEKLFAAGDDINRGRPEAEPAGARRDDSWAGCGSARKDSELLSILLTIL
ncbi:hypothetical protein [Streptomyces mutabilis]|uniref:hypothetical protein n=1 Tax=Streptomyces mutabilis TaxID=67332 RepID=UPI001ADEC0ED|nr:hypothetical protein [Streptomyces mutabilis]